MVGIRALSAAGALLLVGSLSACTGDGSGPPDDASLESFCSAYSRLFSGDIAGTDPGSSAVDQHEVMVEAMRSWGDQLAVVGTPPDMSEQARAGFELIVRYAGDLDAGDVANLALLGEELTDDEMAATEAFEDYATQRCEPPFGDPSR